MRFFFVNSNIQLVAQRTAGQQQLLTFVQHFAAQTSTTACWTAISCTSGRFLVSAVCAARWTTAPYVGRESSSLVASSNYWCLRLLPYRAATAVKTLSGVAVCPSFVISTELCRPAFHIFADWRRRPGRPRQSWLIPRLHNEAGSTSWLVQLTYVIARCLFDVYLMIVSCRLCFILSLHDRASVKQASSKHRANIEQIATPTTYTPFTRWSWLDELARSANIYNCSMFVRCLGLLDDCFV